MKYILPLFRQNAGRVNLGLVNWDSFQAGFRMVLRGDKFAGVTWDPWWRKRESSDRRKSERRRPEATIGHRACREGEGFQRLRLGPDQRGSIHQRPVRDHKSASRENLISFAEFIRGLGKNVLSDENARLLIRMCAALTTRETYESWKQISNMTPFFKEPDWNEKENHEKFRVYAIASFLDLLRPGSIYWKGQSPSVDAMQCVSRIVSILGRASEKAKLQSVRAFFEGGVGLERMSKILSGESLSDKKEVLLLVRANHRLKPKEFYVKLRGPLKDLGTKLSSNPNSYPKQIERLKKQAQAYLATLSRNSRP